MKTSGFQEKVLLFFNRSLVLITKKLNPQRIDLENRAGVAGPPASVRTPARRAFPPEPHTRTHGARMQPGWGPARRWAWRDALASGLFSLEMKI